MSQNSGSAGASTPPVNLTELEIAFARDPSSEAFLPLCEAYLAQKRFMEAMVLGKKAVKARPEDKSRRLLLARVYEEQGKLPKAMDELTTALSSEGGPRSLLHTAMGRLQQKSGNNDAAITSFKSAVDDDDNPEAVAALAALGVEYRKAAAPVAPAAPAAGVRPAARPDGANSSALPALAGEVPAGSGIRPPLEVRSSVLPPVGSGQGGASGLPAERTYSQAPGTSRPPSRRPRPRPALTEAELGIAPTEEPKHGLSKTLALAAGGAIMLGVLVAGMTIHRSRTEALARLSKPAREQLANDSLVSLRRSEKNFKEMLDISGSQPLALASSAYIKAILVTQYGLASEKDALEKLQDKAESKAKKTSLTYVTKAMLETAEGNPEKALETLASTREKLGENPALQIALGDAYVAMGKLEEAGRAYQSARERGARDARALWASAEFHRMLGKKSDAMNYYDSALRLASDHVPARLGRVFMRLRGGGAADLQAAQTDLSRLAELTDGLGPRYSAFLQVARLDYKRQSGEQEDVIKDLLELVKTLDHHPDLTMALARAYTDAGKHAEAIKVLREALLKQPANFAMRTALIRANSASGKHADAEKEVAEAQKILGENNLDLAIELGVVRREKRDFRGALGAFKKAHEISKGHPRILLEQARTFMEVKKLPEALTILRKAIEGSDGLPASFQAEVFCTTAATLLAQKNAALALDSAEQALKVDPSYMEGWYWKGMALREKNKDEARAAFQHYLDKLPKGPLAAASVRERDALH